MANYDVIVIGAGNGGMTAAASLAKNGVKTLLLERHNVPGGCATSFCRGRFEFEVALHQLSGFGGEQNPGPLYGFLKDLGVLENLNFMAMENLYRITVPGEMDIILPANRQGTMEALIKRFPEEKEGIDGFIDLIYRFFYEMIGAFMRKDPDASAEKYPLAAKYTLRPVQAVMDEYLKDPLLKLALGVYWCYMGVGTRFLTFMDYAMLMYSYLEWKPYHLTGGSQALSNAIVDVFLSHGGTARFNTEVKKIIVENGAVQGVVTASGETITASYVISNASLPDTYIEMIGDEALLKKPLENMRQHTVGPSAVTMYVGLDCPPETVGITEATNFLCSVVDLDRQFESTRTLDAEHQGILLSCYNLIDPDASPPGTTQAAIVDLNYAEPWYEVPPQEYAAEKFRVADIILSRIEAQFPGFREHIEEIEVATPITHMRFLGTPGGAIYGFDQYAKDTNLFVSPRPPVQGLFLAGAWAGAGGFQPTLMSGGTAARAVIKDMRSRKEGFQS